MLVDGLLVVAVVVAVADAILSDTAGATSTGATT
jgi:hypothetical protein